MRLRTVGLMVGGLAIVAGSFWLTLTVLRHVNSTGAPATVQPATRVSLDSFYVVPGCSFSGDATEKLLITLPQQYSYAVNAALPFPPSTATPGRIRARLQVLEGQLSILVVDKIGQGAVIAEKAVDVSGEPVQVDLEIPDATKARQVVLRNVSANGTRARARIFSVEAMF
jgi:hypothetical protein